MLEFRTTAAQPTEITQSDCSHSGISCSRMAGKTQGDQSHFFKLTWPLEAKLEEDEDEEELIDHTDTQPKPPVSWVRSGEWPIFSLCHPEAQENQNAGDDSSLCVVGCVLGSLFQQGYVAQCTREDEQDCQGMSSPIFHLKVGTRFPRFAQPTCGVSAWKGPCCSPRPRCPLDYTRAPRRSAAIPSGSGSIPALLCSLRWQECHLLHRDQHPRLRCCPDWQGESQVPSPLTPPRRAPAKSHRPRLPFQGSVFSGSLVSFTERTQQKPCTYTYACC